MIAGGSAKPPSHSYGRVTRKSRIALIVHHPEQIELVRQGALRIQSRIGQSKLHGCLGLRGTLLLHQLVALQCDVVLEIDGAGIEIGGGLKQGDRDGSGTIEYLPGHRASALALWKGAVTGRYCTK